MKEIVFMTSDHLAKLRAVATAAESKSSLFGIDVHPVTPMELFMLNTQLGGHRPGDVACYQPRLATRAEVRHLQTMRDVASKLNVQL